MKKIFLTVIIAAAIGSAHSQRQSQMVAACATNAPASASNNKSNVLLKWFGKEVIFKNGVYLYRVHP